MLTEIEWKMSQDKPVIFPPQRITSDNAERIHKDIEGILTSCETKRFVLDAKDLQYISSAGLRMLLALTKAKYDFELINVSNDVYEILDMTGFLRLLKVHKRLREMSIEGLPVIGRGTTSKVYRVDKDTVLKVFTPEHTMEAIELELLHAKEAFLMGVTTAISYDIVKVGDAYGTVYEMLDAQTLADVLREHPEREDELIHSYAEFMRQMHGVELNMEVFGNEKDRYVLALDTFSEKCTPEEYRMMRSMIEAVPDRTTFGHGDFHPRNVMLQNDEPILIDMGEASCAHPIFSIMAFGVLRLLGNVVSDAMALQFAGMNVEQTCRVWDKFLKNYFETEDSEQLEKINTVVLCYSAIRAWRICVQYTAFPPQLAAYCMDTFHKLYEAGGSNLESLNL